MRRTMGGMLALVGLGVAGCATVTPVVTVPGPNKDAATFHKDDEACRKEASQTAYGTATPAAPPAGSTTSSSGLTGTNAQWQRYFASLAQCATAHGEAVAAVPWAVAYSAYLGYPAPYPVATGYPIGYGWGYPYGWAAPYGYDPFFPGYFGGFYGVGFGYGPYFYRSHGWAHGGWYHGGFSRGGSFGGFHH